MPRKYVPPPLELVKSRIEELLPPAAKEEIQGGDVVLIDVRDPERYEAGHLEGAVNVPAGESARDAHDAAYVEAIESAGAGPDDRVILVCGEGNRSARAADALANEHGFKRRRLDHRRVEALERARVPDRGRDRDRRRRGRDTLGRRGGHNLMASTETIEQVKERIEEVDPAEAHEELKKGGVALIDTREPYEHLEAHIDGAELIRPADVADRIEEVVPDHSQRVILYCASGNRSARAADELRELGYENAASVRGGIKAWEAEGLPVVMAEGMTPEQRNRYSRHTLLPEVGVEGQLKMLNAKVLLVGAGGLGAPAALYLAAAGIGTLGLVDDDEVDESNLQRQVIHNTERIGQPKTESARKTIEALNPDVEVIEHRTRLDASNIIDIIKDYDVIVDGADNFPTRYLLNDASVRLRKPVVSASILAFDGQISTFMPFEGPCYRCLYPTPPPAELAPSCGAAGVLGVMAGVMGLLQANEVIKLVVGIGEPLIGRLLLYDSLGTHFTELKVRRDPECPICGPNAQEIPESEMGKFPDYELFCAG